MSKQNNLQDQFLGELKETGAPVSIFLLSGIKLQGEIQDFDSCVVVLSAHNNHQMIYKHAISTVVPAAPLKLA